MLYIFKMRDRHHAFIWPQFVFSMIPIILVCIILFKNHVWY